jgi:prepilin-type N-terminal cleavage/methylation domain-containing protein
MSERISEPRFRRSPRSDGFSLLEVLIAMMILSIGAASVLALFAGAANTHRRALDRTESALVAEQILAEVAARYVDGLTADEVRARVEREVPAIFGDATWRVELFHPADVRMPREEVADAEPAIRPDAEWEPEELFARVVVRWKRGGTSREDSFYTLLLPRNVPDFEREDSGAHRRSGRFLPAPTRAK